MKRLLAALTVVGIALPALAADVTVTVPAPAVPRSVALCDLLRLELQIRTADWSTGECGAQALRIGLLALEKKYTERASRNTVRQDVNDAVDSFKANWPPPTAAICGDGQLDSEFGEACDDGNLVDGDGCDDSCQIEP